MEVAVAVVLDGAGQVLLTRRHDAAHQGGLWEFPGGKCEAGEDVSAALRREIHEELGIEIREHQPLIVVEHDYGDKCVRLDVHLVTAYIGEPQAREGQPMRWVRREALADYAFPAANGPIVERVMMLAETSD
ncbi:MAG: 8-oxo-dGTP diphosphatase MutT [Halieaceae bacterium]|nr:8-oxo-dGTP diphosphatase MutT [Halieaceae bacterium]